MCKNIEAPQIAKDHGMTCLVFEDDFDSYDTIDVNNTGEKGYNWYVERPYNFTTIEAGVDYKVENSILTMCNRNPLYNYGMGTYHPSKKLGWWFCKGVLEFRVRIPNPNIPEGNSGKGIPAVWSFTPATLTDDTIEWVEPDWMEYWADDYWTTAIHHARRDSFKGPRSYGSTNSNYRGLRGMNDKQWHTLTFLWDDGRIEAYMDGKQSMIFTYESGIAEPPVRLKKGEPRTDQYRTLEWEPETLILGGSQTAPLEIDWIRVWQRPLQDVRDLKGNKK